MVIQSAQAKESLPESGRFALELDAHSAFIVKNQQHRDPTKWYDGLFSLWDRRQPEGQRLLGPDHLGGQNAYAVSGSDDPSNSKCLLVAEKLVRIKVTPAFKFNFVIMKQGVLQHLDRQYTYDVVPAELLTGLLFQGVHRPPKGTGIEIELLAPAKIFFFFHYQVDGGYSEIFAKLKNWKRCAVAPQYDIRNGDHGLKMVMFQLEADAGTYVIPPTTTDRACFNIVFHAKE